MTKFHSRPDYILMGAVIVLLILGILIISSVSSVFSQKKFNTTYYFLNHQLIFGIIPGIILAIFFFKIPLSFLKKYSVLFFFINVLLLIMVFLPFVGAAFGGAQRWIKIGNIIFQPSELLKLTFILYLAYWLSHHISGEKISGNKKEKNFRFKGLKSVKKNLTNFSQIFFAFLIIIFFISFLLIKQPDMGTLGIIIITAILMFFLAGTPLWQNLLIFLLDCAGFLILIKIAAYRLARIMVFLHPEIDPLGKGYQIKQSLIAIGSGGIFGLGLGMSKQKFGFLPNPISDSIFSIFSEETGFIGVVFLIILFLIFLWRGIKISKEAKNQFSQLTALGITIWIVLQGFLNIGSLTGILPLTGVPLPFISYGGSGLITELIGVGILLNISKDQGRTVDLLRD